MPIFIIEHLEKRIYKWCLIEYKHISKIVGKNNLWFTNTKSKELKKYGKVFEKSVSELNLKKACILDPDAKKVLNTKDVKKFNYFIFGGILGDYPRKKRTKSELTKKLNFENRNIGKKQLSTDNAVYVAKEILNGKSLNKIKFKDKIEIELGKYDSVILPYRYAIVNKKPLISNELITYLKRRKGF